MQENLNTAFIIGPLAFQKCSMVLFFLARVISVSIPAEVHWSPPHLSAVCPAGRALEFWHQSFQGTWTRKLFNWTCYVQYQYWTISHLWILLNPQPSVYKGSLFELPLQRFLPNFLTGSGFWGVFPHLLRELGLGQEPQLILDWTLSDIGLYN